MTNRHGCVGKKFPVHTLAEQTTASLIAVVAREIILNFVHNFQNKHVLQCGLIYLTHFAALAVLQSHSASLL